jgi:hypothetical protein
MNINIASCSDRELAEICIKHNIIQTNELRQYTRDNVVSEISKWCHYKQESYKLRKRSNSAPNIHQAAAAAAAATDKTITRSPIQRTHSSPLLVQKQGHATYVPKASVQRDRRMSEPFTGKEKVQAQTDHQMKQQHHQVQTQAQQQFQSDPNMKTYDEYGMYPVQNRVVAIGDLHGDLRVTLMALRLAGVIGSDIYPHNVSDIQWIGGQTYVVQLGDQIDRCRPSDWVKNCIDKLDDVIEDEGNNMMIIQIFQKLDAQAKKVGGRVLGMIGNHELMNVDRDFRYVSPKEFLEFVPPNERGIKRTEDGYPYGYYHRLKVFERGGNIAKHYAVQKRSITMIGSTLFIHGGLSHALAEKYSLHEINQVVQKWLLKQESKQEGKVFDEIFRDDDDMSPFWCRLYSEDDGHGENTKEGFQKLLDILNKRNKTLMPVNRIVLAHTPQFMEDKYMNSLYDGQLWRIDVGMSRAFGKHDECGENKYRQIQVLEILGDTQCIPKIIPYQGRFHGEGTGQNASLTGPSFL